MGYRLYATIPNVPHKHNILELGKQYDSNWREFLDNWFGEDNDQGIVLAAHVKQFYDELVKLNNENVENGSIYGLYNLELLKEMVDLGYDMYFDSW